MAVVGLACMIGCKLLAEQRMWRSESDGHEGVETVRLSANSGDPVLPSKWSLLLVQHGEVDHVALKAMLEMM